jgi:hypothetical protein
VSAWKITKGILGAQAIMLVIGTLVFFGVGLVATRDKNDRKPKLTKDGFLTPQGQKLYDHYSQKKKSSVN